MYPGRPVEPSNDASVADGLPPGSAYAEKDGILVHIRDVDRGALCGCVCVGCKRALVARKGAIRQHHFAHQSPIHCPGALETILHRLAKDLFRVMTSIRLPEYRLRLRRSVGDKVDVDVQQLVRPEKVLEVGEVRIESHEGAVIPDIVVVSGGRSLFVEITVCHGVDRAKLRKLRRSNQAALEIRLTEADAWLTPEELLSKPVKDVHCKRWVFHPQQRNPEKWFYHQLRSAARQARQQKRARLVSVREAIEARAPKCKARSGTSPELVAQTLRYDEFVQDFWRTHRRSPSVDETIAFWARLRQESKKS